MKRGDKVLLGLAAAGLAAASGFGVLYGLASQKREAARQQVVRPAIVNFHEQLLATEDKTSTEREQTPLNPDMRSARERIVEYDRLIHSVAFIDNDPEWGRAISLTYDAKSKWPEDLLELLREIVAATAIQLDAIRALAAQDGPVIALDFSKGPDMELPHLAPLRNLARLLLADTIVALDDGDMQRAIDNFDAIYGLSEAVRDEPVLISQLVRIAIASIGTRGIRMLPESGLDPEYADRLIARLGMLDYREQFATGFAGEAMTIEVIFRNPDFQGSAWQPNWDDPFQAGLAYLYSSPVAAPIRYNDEATALEFLGEIQALGTLPYYEALPQLEALDRRRENLTWMQPVSRAFLPALARASGAQARHEALLDLAQLGLAIEQFRDATGAFPGSLNEVAGLVPGGVPLDPFSGAPYIYRPGANTFLLYSVSHNFVDDGGQFINYLEGDIVWRAEPPER